MSITIYKKLTLIVFVVAFLMPFTPVFAAMSSTDYSIQTDSINFGGGNSSSTNYSEQDTLGEVGTGDTSSANYTLHAGYQQMQTSYISISVPGNVSLGNINGLTGGTAQASASVSVVTDNPGGYSLSLQANSSPAMQDSNGGYISDYAPTSPSTPDFAFSIPSGGSVFGFSPQGSDITELYKDNGSDCNTGSLDTVNSCWNGFTTTPQVIAQGTANQPTGATTTIEFKAGISTTKNQDAGSYSAIITITAVTL